MIKIKKKAILVEYPCVFWISGLSISVDEFLYSGTFLIRKKSKPKLVIIPKIPNTVTAQE